MAQPERRPPTCPGRLRAFLGVRATAFRAGWRPAAVAVTVFVALVLSMQAMPVAQSSFSATTGNATSNFAAAASFGCTPSSSTLSATADSYVDQNSPGSNYGTSSSLYAQAAQTAVLRRTLLTFALPALGGCQLASATLRLNVTAISGTRTMRVTPLATAWAENTVTWSNQPAAAGSTATQQIASTGNLDINVTSLITGIYAGTNHGLLVSDNNETAPATPRMQTFTSREGATAPKLILSFNTCGPSPTLDADADAEVNQAVPGTNYGTGNDVNIKTAAGANKRTFVRFPLPTLPAGCAVTAATLTYEPNVFSNYTVGTVVDVYRAAASWTETGLTWSNQPATTGSPVSAAQTYSPTAFTVTSQVQAMYAGTNTGFMIRFQTESAASGAQLGHTSREYGWPVTLTLTIA